MVKLKASFDRKGRANPTTDPRDDWSPIFFFKSGLLAIVGLLLAISCLAAIIAAIVPFWFSMDFSVTYPNTFNRDSPGQTVTRTMNVGLYFMNETRFINMLMLEKSSNDSLAPPMFRVAQLFYMLGTTGLIICCAATFIMGGRRYASPSGELFLAGATGPVAFCMLLGVVMALLSWAFERDVAWNHLPYSTDTYQMFSQIVKVVPTTTPNWGLYIGALAALLSLVCAVLMWIQACTTCNQLQRLRHHQLYSPLPTEDDGVRFIPRPVRATTPPAAVSRSYTTQAYQPEGYTGPAVSTHGEVDL